MDTNHSMKLQLDGAVHRNLTAPRLVEKALERGKEFSPAPVPLSRHG